MTLLQICTRSTNEFRVYNEVIEHVKRIAFLRSAVNKPATRSVSVDEIFLCSPGKKVLAPDGVLAAKP